MKNKQRCDLSSRKS